MAFVFPPHLLAALPVAGSADSFPVRRVYCVGRNYADHAREMGALEQAEGREPPFFFMKPGDTVVSGAGEISVAYPPATNNLHHEVELIVALGAGGANVVPRGLETGPFASQKSLIFGYAVGLDLTRRDIQGRAKEKGQPWDMGKGFDQSAVAGVIQPVGMVGHPDHGRIWLSVNGEIRQDGDLAAMMWKVADIIANLFDAGPSRSRRPDLHRHAGRGRAARPGRPARSGVDGVGTLRARIV